MDFGSVPDWFAAVGTVGALLLALALLFRESQERRRQQARLVSGWITELSDDGREPLTSLIIQNKSDEPVYDVDLWWFDPVAHEQVGEPGAIALHVDVLPPDSRRQAAESMPTRMGTIPRLTVDFTDAAGRGWRRSGGTLRRRLRR